MKRNKKLYQTSFEDGFFKVVYSPGEESEVACYYGKYGSYIYDVTEKPGCLGEQVCERMKGCGSTLRTDRDDWENVVKRELRKWAYDIRRDERI